MLIALFVVFLFAGGGGDISGSVLTTDTLKQLGQDAEMAIVNPARALKAEDAIEGLIAEVKGFEKAFSKSGKELTDLYKDHSADGAQVLAVLEELNSTWDAAQKRAIDLRFELKDSLTAEEWSQVFSE